MKIDINEFPSKLISELRFVMRSTSAVFSGHRIEIGRITHEAAYMISCLHSELQARALQVQEARDFGKRMQKFARVALAFNLLLFLLLFILILNA